MGAAGTRSLGRTRYKRETLSRRPRGRWVLNQDSPHAQGLAHWWPMIPGRDARDVAGRSPLILAGQGDTTGPVWVADAEMGPVPLLTKANNDIFLLQSTTITAPPLTLMAWGFGIGTANGQTAVTINTHGSADHNWQLRYNATADTIVMRARTTANGTATTSAGPGLNTWFHACGVERSSTDRAAFLNGRFKGINTTNRAPSGVNATSVGAMRKASVRDEWDGKIADARIYNRALTDAEVFSQWHPATRWDLYHELGRVKYFVAAVARTTKNIHPWHLGTPRGMGHGMPGGQV